MNMMKNELLSTFEDVQTVIVVGRRWFEKTNGNTYHSAEIYVNGKFVHKIDFDYGYGSQYEWNAFNWLKKNGYIKNADTAQASPGWYCREHGIDWATTVTDVNRKKDL
jgi:hypothetical protein